MTDAERGLIFDAGTVTVEEYLDRWLKDSVKDTVRRSTFAQYKSVVNCHLIPALGRLKLKALTPTHVRGLYREKLDSGLGARMVQYIHVTLHKALKQAVMDGLIPRNVTEAVKAPQAHKKEVKPLTPNQVKVLLSAASEDRVEALYIVAIHTGLRRSELLGLKWTDVDLDTGILSVQRSLDKDGRSIHPSVTRAGEQSSSRARPWKPSKATAFASTKNDCVWVLSGKITA